MANLLHFPAAQPESSDVGAREQALNTRASWIAEAPAGSGKTGLLLQRYLKLLAEPEVIQPEEILAITFTRKATAELRDRVLRELESAWNELPFDDTKPFAGTTRELAQAVLLRDHQLGWQILQNPNRLRIRTIDSICVEIAAAFPLLSGGGSGRTPVEDAEPLYQLAARRTLLQLGGSDPALDDALRTVLLHRDASLTDVEHLVARMLAAREQWAELVPLDRSELTNDVLENIVRPRLERTLENIVCAGLTRATQALAPNTLRSLTTLAHRLSIEPGYNGAESPIAFCGTLNEPPQAVAEHLDHWIALINLILTKDGTSRRSFNVNHILFSASKADKAVLQTMAAEVSDEATLHAVRSLPPARYPDAQWRIAKALFRLLLHALAELKVLFAERGECDFAEFSLTAREALRSDSGPADLAISASATLRHLLVDEMQDTSASQYELIETLTRHWDGHSQTLFLVGDPKQSIYLFRQARVERFLRTVRQQRLGDVPIGHLQLTSNFRSQTELVKSFNESFHSIFPQGINTFSGESIDVPFVAATATREATDTAGSQLHTTLLPAPGTAPAPNHTQDEANTIRQIIEFWRAKPLPPDRGPWKIAVLARVRRHLAPIVAELTRAEIPFRAVNVEALNERAEVLDALALTRALLHPADRVAWLAVLHAPWCGLDRADLLALTSSAPDDATIPSLLESQTNALSSTGQTLLNRVRPTLRAALANCGRAPLALNVSRTWFSLGGDAALRPAEFTNVQRFFSLLRELEQPGGWVDLRALTRRMERLFAEAPAQSGAVDLMTIHSAKGLEWDVVLIPGLERKGQSSRSDLLNWLELDSGSSSDGPSAVILAPIATKGSEPDKLYRWLNSVRSAREAAERKRLFYVACTRAREELHLFAACKSDIQGYAIAPPADSLLHACWPWAGPQFAQLAATQDLGQTSTQEEGDQDFDLAIAAAATAPKPPIIQRLPLTFDPLERYNRAAADPLPYIPASALRQAPAFQRPEGSFAVRAFGNVVHRFLQLMAERLATIDSATLLSEMPYWQPRLQTSLRGEGLAPTLAQRESTRAHETLTRALNDPIGLWLLSPQPSAATESALTFAAPTVPTLRVDRTFLAAATPLIAGTSHIWIVDFKTTEQGSRSNEKFEVDERAKYSDQLNSYATARRSLASTTQPIILALYYPAIPRIIFWPAPV